MSQLLPTVRYLVVCEDVQVDENNPRRISLIGLLSAIRSIEESPFPLLYRELCVFLQITECRGAASGRVEIIHADTEQVLFRTRERTIPFGINPLEVFAYTFRIRNCLFPMAGLYYVQFWYNEHMVAQQPLILR